MMTCATFTARMEIICRSPDTTSVKRDGLLLIVTELGAGVPGYLPALEIFMKRLDGSDWGPIDGLGGSDGS